MSEHVSDHEDESGVPPHIKTLIFAGILLCLCLLVFGGIAAILASKYSSNKSSPSTDPYVYYNSAPAMMKSTDAPALINEQPLVIERDFGPGTSPRAKDIERIELETRPPDFEPVQTPKSKLK